MNANERELILKEEVYAVVSCAIEVLNIRGHGLHEKIYENCLCVEFRLRGIHKLSKSGIRSCIKVRSWANMSPILWCRSSGSLTSMRGWIGSDWC